MRPADRAHKKELNRILLDCKGGPMLNHKRRAIEQQRLRELQEELIAEDSDLSPADFDATSTSLSMSGSSRFYSDK